MAERSWTVCRECQGELDEDGECPFCRRLERVLSEGEAHRKAIGEAFNFRRQSSKDGGPR